MSKKKSEGKHKLLITYEIVSKSRRFYYLFKPKEVIIGELSEIKFIIKNISNRTFPGGKITHLKIQHVDTPEKMKYYENDVEIPRLSRNKSFTTPELKYIPINSGNTWFYLYILPLSGKIEYYQQSRATKNPASLGEDSVWDDYFTVASRESIKNRYLSYISIFLASITVITTLIILTLNLLR